jgi:sigma-B regulation protein RsbU (phosphoserine phosphatase)
MPSEDDRSGLPRPTGYETWIYQKACPDSVGEVFLSTPLPKVGEAHAGCWLVALGSVTGRGAHAARLKAALESELARLARSETDPASLLEALNHGPEDLAGPVDFATMLTAVLDGDRHELVLGNAGSIPPLLRRPDGRIEVLGEGVCGFPLWVLEGHEYGTITVPIDPGDVLVFFSDGVTATVDHESRVFDMARLRRSIAEAPDGAAAVGRSVVDAVRRFESGCAQADDITLFCLGRTS